MHLQQKNDAETSRRTQAEAALNTWRNRSSSLTSLEPELDVGMCTNAATFRQILNITNMFQEASRPVKIRIQIQI